MKTTSRIPFSLRLKIAMAFVILVVVIMATVTYIFTIRELKLRVEEVSLRMERLANNIATIRSVETEDWDTYQVYIDHQLDLNPDIVYIAIFDENNALKAHSLNTDWVDLDGRAALDKLEQATVVWRLDQRQLTKESQKDLESKSVNLVIGDRNRGTVKVGFSLVDLNNAIRKNLIWNLGLAGIFMIFAVLISLPMSRRIVIPLGKLNRAMLKISEGDFNQELILRSRDEIGEMAKTFNFMTKGLQEKKAIEDFHRDLSFTLDMEKILRLIAERITQTFSGRGGLLFLKEKNAPGRYRLAASFPKTSSASVMCHPDKASRDRLMLIREPFLVSETSIAAGMHEVRIRNLGPQALVCPMIRKDDLIGFFILDNNDKNKPYSSEERAFLKTMTTQSSFAAENALLLDELTEQERMKRELEIARTVQKSLLPRENPEFPGLDIDGICIPAQEVGGDYFDFFPIDENRLGIVIADVAGKGTSAAFHMAVIKGMMVSITRVLTSPKKLLIELNRRLYEVMERNMFVTMSYGIADIKKRRFTFARAGHCTLMWKNAKTGNVDFLLPPGIALGMESGEQFKKNISEKTISFGRGDCLLLFTDGVTESMTAGMVEFGEKALRNILRRSHGPSQRIRQDIVLALNRFAKGKPRHDDITIVTVIAA